MAESLISFAKLPLLLMPLTYIHVGHTASVRFRSRPKGLTGLSVLCVIIFHQVSTCFQNDALITNKPVSQKYHRLDQRLPSVFGVVKATGFPTQAFGNDKAFSQALA